MTAILSKLTQIAHTAMTKEPKIKNPPKTKQKAQERAVTSKALPVLLIYLTAALKNWSPLKKSRHRGARFRKHRSKQFNKNLSKAKKQKTRISVVNSSVIDSLHCAYVVTSAQVEDHSLNYEVHVSKEPGGSYGSSTGIENKERCVQTYYLGVPVCSKSSGIQQYT